MKRHKLWIAIAAIGFAAAVFFVMRGGSDSSELASVSASENAIANAVSSVRPENSASLAAIEAAALSPRGTEVVRIVANATITEKVRRELADFGARVIAPIGPRAVLVEATPAAVRRIVGDKRFTAEAVLPEQKVQKRLAGMVAENPNGNVKVSVIGLAVSDREGLAAFVSAQGGKLLHSPLGPEALGAEIPSALVASLAARGDVRWLEPAPEHCLLNDKTVVEAGANVDRLRTRHRLMGRGQKVTVCDTGLDKGLTDDVHLDFSGRVKEIIHIGKSDASSAGLQWTLADYNGHGTHVAGTVLGSGKCSDGQYKGMAPSAELYFQAACDTEGAGVWIDNYESLLSKSVANGSYIHSDSWGSTYGRIVYDSTDYTFDKYLWNHPELLVVVAAGNAGDEWTGDRSISSYPACAKNVLTVGNTMSSRPTKDWFLPGNPENLNPTSSRGPTADGRIKPEIAAPGTAVYSTLSTKSLECDPIYFNKYYTEMTGTSMATPLVSGTAALIREWLADRRGMTELPTAALMKAIIAGGGVQMTGVGAHKVGTWTEFNLPQEIPNTDYGWGRVNLEETLYPTNGRAIKFFDRIPFADQTDWTIDITTTNEAPLDVQLCWIDYPAAASTDDGQTLINDLDLIVSNKTTGAVWCGNGIAGGDHTNTMESVRIAAADAPAGDYAVIVRGSAVAYDSTIGGAAAVYVRGAFEDETAPDPIYIRNVRTNERYVYLDEALEEVQSGDTIEIEKPVSLAKSVTLAVSCTIVATNADPLASLVTREDGAMISLAAGVDLTLTNLVFVSGDETTAVTVAAGSRVILSGTVGVGTVAVTDAEGILFAAPIALAGDRLSVSAPNGFAIGAQFGHWKGDYHSSSNAASRVVNLLNEELGAIAEKMTGRLIWGVIPCNPEDAKCVVDGIGISTTYCRTFSQALQVALQQDSTMTLKRSVTMTVPATLSHDLVLTSDGGPVLALEDEAGFIIPEGTAMTVSNLVVQGGVEKLADCAFKVSGGALTLERDTTLKSLSNTYQFQGKPWGGAIAVLAGSVTMKSGSRIEKCVAHDGAVGGGAIYLGGSEATVNLFGGTITGCSAPLGGALYAWGNAKTGSCVNVKGAFSAKDNTTTDGSRSSNLFLCYNAQLSVPDHLLPADSDNTIGLAFGYLNGQEDKNLKEQAFSIRHDGSLPTSGGKSGLSTAKHFFSDIYPNLQGSYVEADNQYWFQWAVVSTTAPTSPFPGAKVWVGRDPDVKYYYRDLNEALADLTWSQDRYIVNIMNNVMLTNDVEISQNVVLQRDPSLYDNPIVFRTADAMYRVVEGGSLSISNLAVWGASWYYYGEWGSDSEVGLISVRGGNLTLGRGADIGLVWGTASRAANAITVWDGGTLTMNPGALISESYNVYEDTSDATGCGGAILLDRSTAYLRGGEIVYSAAYRGGAICVANESTLYVGGSCVVTNNTDQSGVKLDNITVSRSSQLIMDDEFTGSIGYHEGIAGDTNWFGTVTWNWPSIEALTNSAARFVHDKTGSHGVAVTNGLGGAVLVWSDWISKAGKYVDPTGGVYRVFIGVGQSVVIPKNFSAVSQLNPNGKFVIQLEGAVDGCWYTVYSTDDLLKPFDTVEACVQLKQGEAFEFEIDKTNTSKYYKIVAEEGIK